jgi:hypothetical protein
MSALTALCPRLCILGALASLTSVSCVFLTKVTPEDTITEFTAPARYTEVIGVATSVLESNGFVVETLRQASVTAVRARNSASPGTPGYSTVSCNPDGTSCTQRGGSGGTGTGVQTVVKVEVMPQGRNTLVRVSVEKRGSAPLYSSDVKLSRKIAKLLEEEFAVSTD